MPPGSAFLNILSLIVITGQELWPYKEFYILIHISKYNHPIYNCNTDIGRSYQTLHFIWLQQKRQTYLWGRYDQKTQIWTVYTSYIIQKAHDQNSFDETLKDNQMAIIPILMTKTYVINGVQYVPLFRISLYK